MSRTFFLPPAAGEGEEGRGNRYDFHGDFIMVEACVVSFAQAGRE